MRIIVIVIIYGLLNSCSNKNGNSDSIHKLENSVWIDSLCNSYHFKDSLVVRNLLFQKESDYSEIGKFHSSNKIQLHFQTDFDEVKKYYLEPISKNKMFLSPLNQYDYPIVLLKKELIQLPDLEIVELKIKINPTFISSNGFRRLSITNNKKIEYIKADNDFELTKNTLSDSTFHHIEQYIEILQLEKYEEEYNFAGFDGPSFELNLITNSYKKTIKSTQGIPKGIRNLINFIDYKLQTEKQN